MLVHWLIESYVPLGTRFLQFTVYLVAAVLWGILASRLVEVPVLTLRDRHFPEATRSLVGQQRETRRFPDASATAAGGGT